jgi:hypothetical protein
MTPEQRIKREILTKAIETFETDEETFGEFFSANFEEYDCDWDGDPASLTAENIDEVYGILAEEESFQDHLQEEVNEFRCGGEETDIAAEWSRHYESESRAVKLADGTWVGWTYWFGGGKHGEPEAVEWMPDAYLLKVTEEEKLVTVRTFEKT